MPTGYTDGGIGGEGGNAGNGADGQHPEPAAGRRVRIGAQQRLARHAEALQVHLVADAVARAREDYAVF